MKNCYRCRQKKSLSEFYKNKRNKDGKSAECKSCRSEINKSRKDYNREYNRIWAKRNPDRTKELRLNRKLRAYNLNQDMFQNMLVQQNYQCAICMTEFTETTPCIDHCHETGVVRGLLCPQCNTALGMFRDDLDILEQAIAYLKQA